MTWFLTREAAEAFYATINKNPDWKYEILPNGCGGGGYGVEVRDEEGLLITENYSNQEEIVETLAERKRRTDDARRRGGKFR